MRFIFVGDVSSVSLSSERQNDGEGLTLETLYADQFTLSTQLIIPNYLVILSHRHLETVSLDFIFVVVAVL